MSDQGSAELNFAGGASRLAKQMLLSNQAPAIKSRLKAIQVEGYGWARPKQTPRREIAAFNLSVTSLDRAVQMLATLASDEAHLSQGELRMQTARHLRRAAVDQSHQSPRVASIALLLSDALLNSAVLDVTQDRQNALRLGLDLLMDSFVPQEREEELLRALIEAGWNITAPFQKNEFADLMEQAGG
jgi:hypothetical protein